ncbi:hypothetical protein ACJQWK_04666 [Exserohilum turcicum]
MPPRPSAPHEKRPPSDPTSHLIARAELWSARGNAILRALHQCTGSLALALAFSLSRSLTCSLTHSLARSPYISPPSPLPPPPPPSLPPQALPTILAGFHQPPMAAGWHRTSRRTPHFAHGWVKKFLSNQRVFSRDD